MIGEKMQKALNEQINAEIYSAYLYLSMSAYCESLSLPGFANWMRVQWQEELTHALKLYDFVNERGGQVVLTAIDGPDVEWESPLAMFEVTLEHERHVTSLIHRLVDLSLAERDHAANSMLQWFVDEQVEEEANAEQLVEELKRIEGQPHALFLLDRELAQRQFVDETQTAE